MSTTNTTKIITRGTEVTVTHTDNYVITEVNVRATNGSGITTWPNDLHALARAAQSLGAAQEAATDQTPVPVRTTAKTTTKAAKKAAQKPVKATANASAAEGEGEPAPRPYRKLTDELKKELIETYNQVRNVSQVAEHMHLPRYTVANWVKKLREAGEIE